MKTKREINKIQRTIEKKLFSSFIIVFIVLSLIPILVSSYLLIHDIITTVNFAPKKVEDENSYIQYGDNGQGEFNLLIISKAAVKEVPKEGLIIGSNEGIHDLSWITDVERFDKRLSFEWRKKELYVISVIESNYLYVYRLTDQLYFFIANILIILLLSVPILIFIKKVSKRITKKIITPLKESYEYQNQLIESINHDVKTPVTAIKLSANRLENSIEENNKEKSLKWLNYINVNNIKLEQMMRKFGYVYMDTEVKKENVNISNLLNENCELLTPLANIENKSIILNIFENIQIWESEDLLNDIIYNLLKNAVEHSKRESEINVYCLKEKNRLKIEIINELNCNIKCIKNFKNLYRQRITQ